MVYIRLLGSLPGPVWLPREGGELEGGIQVYSEVDLELGEAEVHFGRLGGRLQVEPLCSQIVSFRAGRGRSAEPEVQEVSCVPGWRLSSETVLGPPAGCGACGEAVFCCPAPRECLTCGLCGEVCRGPE